MKLTIQNVSRAARGFATKTGEQWIEPGETKTFDFDKEQAARVREIAKRSPRVIELDGLFNGADESKFDHDGDGDPGGVADAKGEQAEAAREVASLEDGFDPDALDNDQLRALILANGRTIHHKAGREKLLAAVKDIFPAAPAVIEDEPVG